MHQEQLTQTVGSLVAEHPQGLRVLDRHGIDYCCGGKRPFDAVCKEKGLSPESVLEEVLSAKPGREDGTDWGKAGLTKLCDHIEATHHVFVKEELPRLAVLAEKVARVHGERHPELPRVGELFSGLKAELEAHLMKEEQILFPLIRQLDQATTKFEFHCGSVANPIRVMEQEHDSAGDALHEMRRLTKEFTTPPDVCTSYRALMEGLDALEKDLHVHIHKENNILFPRAIERESVLAR